MGQRKLGNQVNYYEVRLNLTGTILLGEKVGDACLGRPIRPGCLSGARKDRDVCPGRQI